MAEIFLAMDDALPHEVLSDCRDLCASLADRLGKPVTLAYVDTRTLGDLHSWAAIKTGSAGIVRIGTTASQRGINSQ